MRGEGFTRWFNESATDYGWVYPSLSDVQSPIPPAKYTISAEAWLAQAQSQIRGDGAKAVQTDIAAMYAMVGTHFGMPRGRWTDGARMLWESSSATLGSSWVGSVGDNQAQFNEAVRAWLSSLQDSGLGRASVQWIQNSQAVQDALSSVGDAASNVPWVNIVVAVVRVLKYAYIAYYGNWDRRNGLQDYGTDFEGLPWVKNKIAAYEFLETGASLDVAAGKKVISAINEMDLTDVFSPMLTECSAELRDGRSGPNEPWRPGWSVGMVEADPDDFEADPRLGCVPGTGAVARRYDASAPVFVPDHYAPADEKICAPYWSAGIKWASTGSYLPTLASMGATLWQALNADSALMAGVDTTQAINRWRLACHHLAREILNPIAWYGNPLSSAYGSILWANFEGSTQRCDFTLTLENLWNKAAADLGWPMLRDIAWQTRKTVVPNRPETSRSQIEGRKGSAFLAQWAYQAVDSGALGRQNYQPAEDGWATSQLANIVGLQCAPVLALDALRDRQRARLFGDGQAPVLLPYTTPANPAGPRGQARVDALRDLLQRPEICEVDPDDVAARNMGGFLDAEQLRDAIVIAQSNARCRLSGGKYAIKTLTYQPPPPLKMAELAIPGASPSASPGAALAALAGVGGLLWMLRR
ncbi:MAG: hypothetical protein CMJ32_08025 [Phycisphaerae bacterium]|nr:hypothetical protein [Phycisphaerae bacterium]